MARRDTISQYSTDNIGIGVYERNDYTDPDNNEVSISVIREDGDVTVIGNDLATRDDLGLYSYLLPTSVTSIKGNYTAVWSYVVDGEPKEFKYQFAVVDPQPFFDSLNGEQKQMVENIYHRVSDTFDSTVGGPYLWELPQSSFSFETIAKLMVVDAMNLINYSKPKAFIPPYALGSKVTKPIPRAWYGLVEKAASYELYKHLARSYLEIPLPVGVNVAHLDRTQYSQKWMSMAEFEKQEVESMIHMLKRAMQFGVKSRAQLLAGGIFPISYLNPARPRWPYTLTRFYNLGWLAALAYVLTHIKI